MQLNLSILIPSTPDRRKDLSKLIECISEQYYTRKVSTYDIGEITASRYWDLLSEIEVIVFEDAKILTIGEKRGMLYKHAVGSYSIQVDSDDLLSPNAIELILKAIKENPDIDCITFDEYCLMNGVEYKSRHSLLYDDWDGDGSMLFPEGVHFRRTPFYKDVIRTEIAQSVPFEKIRYGEDHAWARALKPHLTTEYHINEQLYRYIHNSKPEEHNERYGFDK